MIEAYEFAKKYFPGLKLEVERSYARVEMDGKMIITITNGNVENSITAFLNGMVAGYMFKK